MLWLFEPHGQCKSILLVCLLLLLEEFVASGSGEMASHLHIGRSLTDSSATSHVCEGAVTPCTCLNISGCMWLPNANDNGSCTIVLSGTSPLQQQVSQYSCEFAPCFASTAQASPCACAAAAAECHWDAIAGCRAGSFGWKPCSICPTLRDCADPDPLTVVSLEPSNGGVWRGGSTHNDLLEVRVHFSDDATLCHDTKPVAEFKCDGAVTSYDIPRSKVSLAAGILQLDLSSYVEDMSRYTRRSCDVIVSADVICSRSLVPFPGIAQGAYNFAIDDIEPPTIITFEPTKDDSQVSMNQEYCRITFDEPIDFGAAPIYATLSKVEDGWAGISMASIAMTIKLQPPQADIESSTLVIYFNEQLNPGHRYTLSLPFGAVMDLSGNPFEGLVDHVYTFRVVDFQALESEGAQEDAILVVFLVVGAALVVMVVAGIVLRALRCFSSAKGVSIDQRQAERLAQKRQERYSNSQHANDAHATQKSASEPDMWAQRQRAVSSDSSSRASARVHPASGSQQRSFSAEPDPEKGQTTQESGRRDRPSQGLHGGKSRISSNSVSRTSAPVPPKSNSSCAEVLAVEQQMRALLLHPLAVRKKALKELMLEYHPDKNHHENATEVFQFVNSSREWFLWDPG